MKEKTMNKIKLAEGTVEIQLCKQCHKASDRINTFGLCLSCRTENISNATPYEKQLAHDK